MKLKTKLITTFLSIGLIPVLVIGGVAWNVSKAIERGVNKRLESTAIDAIDKIERNMFERYGDVQAFGYNAAARDTSLWYKPAADNVLVNTMDQYIQAYGCYYLSIIVDA